MKYFVKYTMKQYGEVIDQVHTRSWRYINYLLTCLAYCVARGPLDQSIF